MSLDVTDIKIAQFLMGLVGNGYRTTYRARLAIEDQTRLVWSGLVMTPVYVHIALPWNCWMAHILMFRYKRPSFRQHEQDQPWRITSGWALFPIFIRLISIHRIGDLDPQVVHLPVNLLVYQEVWTDNMGRISHGGALQAGRHSWFSLDGDRLSSLAIGREQISTASDWSGIYLLSISIGRAQFEWSGVAARIQCLQIKSCRTQHNFLTDERDKIHVNSTLKRSVTVGVQCLWTDNSAAFNLWEFRNHNAGYQRVKLSQEGLSLQFPKIVKISL